MAPGEPPVALSDDELAEGMWLAFDNASRLIDDAKILIEARRYLSAQAVLRIAVEEGGKLLLLLQAVYWEKTDSKKWLWLWRTWDKHKPKLRLIELLFHWPSYLPTHSPKRFDETIAFLSKSREAFWYVDYDQKKRAYQTPERWHETDAEAALSARAELEYTMTILRSLALPIGGSVAELRERIPEIRSTNRDAMRWVPPDLGSDAE
jgi:AbiV family abortive infection protein